MTDTDWTHLSLNPGPGLPGMPHTKQGSVVLEAPVLSTPYLHTLVCVTCEERSRKVMERPTSEIVFSVAQPFRQGTSVVHQGRARPLGVRQLDLNWQSKPKQCSGRLEEPLPLQM